MKAVLDALGPAMTHCGVAGKDEGEGLGDIKATFQRSRRMEAARISAWRGVARYDR